MENEKGNEGGATFAVAEDMFGGIREVEQLTRRALAELEQRIWALEVAASALKVALINGGALRQTEEEGPFPMRALSPTVLITRKEFALLHAARGVCRKWELEGGMRPVGACYDTLHYAYELSKEKRGERQ